MPWHPPSAPWHVPSAAGPVTRRSRRFFLSRLPFVASATSGRQLPGCAKPHCTHNGYETQIVLLSGHADSSANGKYRHRMDGHANQARFSGIDSRPHPVYHCAGETSGGGGVMDAETRALLVGLYKTLTKLTVTLVEQGALDSNSAVRGFQEFAKTLGDGPHDQAARLWVDHLVETLEADRSSAEHLPGTANRPSLPRQRTVHGREKYAGVIPTQTSATVTFSSDLPGGLDQEDHSKPRDDLPKPATSDGHMI